LIVFFCYFYTAVTFNPVDVADNLKKYGGFIPGIRPGRYTADYIDRILSRITLGGAIYVSAVCILPTILIQRFNVPFYFGGTALLIVVGVALDTMAQIQTHLIARNYEGFMRRGRVRRPAFAGREVNWCAWFCWVRLVQVRVLRRECLRTKCGHRRLPAVIC
jgi:preprotein translocase subunit SecY